MPAPELLHEAGELEAAIVCGRCIPAVGPPTPQHLLRLAADQVGQLRNGADARRFSPHTGRRRRQRWRWLGRRGLGFGLRVDADRGQVLHLHEAVRRFGVDQLIGALAIAGRSADRYPRAGQHLTTMRTALLGREVAVAANPRSLPAGHPIRDPHIDMHSTTGSALHAGASEHRVPGYQGHAVLFQLLSAAVVLGVEVDRHHLRGRDHGKPDLLALALRDRDPLQHHLGLDGARMADQLRLSIGMPERWVLARDRRLQGIVLENRLPLTAGLVPAMPAADLCRKLHRNDGLQLDALGRELAHFLSQEVVSRGFSHRPSGQQLPALDVTAQTALRWTAVGS